MSIKATPTDPNFYPPTLKVFMVFGKCRREMLCSVVFTYEFGLCLHKKGCIYRPKAPIQDQKAFQALKNSKIFLEIKRFSDRPTLFYFGMRA